MSVEPEAACAGACAGCSDRGGTARPWMTGTVAAGRDSVPVVSTVLRWRDRLGGARVRLGIRRRGYTVEPGLYAVGQPSDDSPVFVTANYKLTFDSLREELGGTDGWILVLDTRGINVWCAAGKGTFGTEEIVNRVRQCRLDQVVRHRALVVPQLGAPGVAAHEVRQACGFRVVYGPVRARDIRAFLANGMEATPSMRLVLFGLRDRLAVVPVELTHWGRYALVVAGLLWVLAGWGRGGYSLTGSVADGWRAASLLLGAFLGGTVVVPVLLPWLPGRAFSLKGFWVGLAVGAALLMTGILPTTGRPVPAIIGWLLLACAVAAFAAMNYTGSTPYTSLSGVRKEVRIAGPLQLVAGLAGVLLWQVSRLL